MEKRAAVAQERFAFAGSELQLKAHKVRSGAAAVKFCLPNLRFVLCPSVLFGFIHGQKRVWTGANV